MVAEIMDPRHQGGQHSQDQALQRLLDLKKKYFCYLNLIKVEPRKIPETETGCKSVQRGLGLMKIYG
jgi:hypothetical protein